MSTLVFNEATAMERIGDMDFIKELLQDFYNEIPNDMSTLKKAIISDDVENVRIIAHTVKGTGANLSLDAISDIAKQLEMAAKETRKNDFMDLFQSLENEIARFKNFADGFFD